MRVIQAQKFALFSLAMLAMVLPVSQAWAEQSPAELLRRVELAVNNSSYRGTLLRSFDGRLETMHVVHRNDNGVVREKLIAMDGEGREIIRNGDELLCIFPRRRIVLIESAAGSSNSFVRLPAAVTEIDNFYDFSLRGQERIANRKALLFVVAPRDGFRYGHRLWVDAKTLLPLRMQLVSDNSRIVEEVRFTDVEIDIEIGDEAFTSAIDTTDFKWIRGASLQQGVGADVADADSISLAPQEMVAWPEEQAAGFRLSAARRQTTDEQGRVSQQLVFTDGLASVSVFLESRPEQAGSVNAEMQSRLGAAHSYQRSVGSRTVTVVGEVPAKTVRLLGRQAELRMRASELSLAPSKDR